jgi:hypothetical protein
VGRINLGKIFSSTASTEVPEPPGVQCDMLNFITDPKKILVSSGDLNVGGLILREASGDAYFELSVESQAPN